jgi:hypothetical protein
MIDLLKSLLSSKSGEGRGRNPASRAAAKPAVSASDFRAVSLAPSLECCAATKGAASRRYLWREAPRLPLAGCEMGSNCSCRFIKHSDRREGDRRLLGCNSTKQWFMGGERRTQQGRRTA